MIVGVAGVPQDLAVSRDYDAIFSHLQASGISVYTPTSQYQENPVALTLGLESDFLPPPFGTADPSIYEAMRAHGITLVISADQLYDPNEPMPAPENDPLLALINAAGRDLIHAIYGYDEPAHQGVSVSASQALYEHVKSLDPTISIVQIHRNLDENNPEHLTPEGMAEYLALVEAHAQWADIVGFDIYPIGLSRGSVTPYSNGEMVSPAQAVQDYMTWLQAELPDSQHALVLQAFNVLDLYSDEMLATLDPEVIAALTPPTVEELSSMLAAAHEADEIYWWGQSHITDSTTSQLWQDVLAQTQNFLAGYSDTDILGTEAAETLIGTENAERISGAGGDDVLFGGDGGDTLVGGMGADEMIGGTGSDLYYVDNVSDVVAETGGTGIDSVRTSLTTFDLGSASVEGDVEILVGTLGTGQLLIGNELDNFISGSWGDDTLSGAGGNDTLAGGIGDDTYIVHTSSVTIDELANAGNDTILTSLASFSLQAAGLSSEIENLTGALNTGQHLTGNALNNTIGGGAGSDHLEGGGGHDTLKGGFGSDVYLITGFEIADETGGSGIDEIRTDLSGFDLKGPNINGAIENLTGTSDGGQFLIGNSLNNFIAAGAGNDTLDGDVGADTMQGGFGDDLYMVGQSNDAIIEGLNAGTDTVISSASFTMSDNIERMLLTGSAAINATGNASNNYLQGNSAANLLDGKGGSDTMVGGDGNDIYIIDHAGDIAGESNAVSATGGIDAVYSYVSNHTLGAYIENGRILATGSANLTGNALNNLLFAGAGNNILNGSSGTDTASYAYAGSAVSVSLAIGTVQTTGGSGADTLINIENLAGSAFNDVLTGNAGANVLNGGVGADQMAGGNGSDYYYVDNVRDVVSEFASSGGIDTVYSLLASYTLAENVERAIILNAGSANLTGNDLNNVLVAGTGNNVLNGAGGLDTVSYANANGAVSVNLAIVGPQITASSGSDTLLNIENLIGSSYADILTGNSGTNSLIGGSGADMLNGAAGNDILNGGAGHDQLIGGAGADIFVFNSALDTANFDSLVGYNSAEDTIYLENTGIFAALSLGTLAAGAFNTGSVATQADDRILYNATTGALYYDADGNGSMAAVQFATISGLTGIMTGSEFVII